MTLKSLLRDLRNDSGYRGELAEAAPAAVVSAMPAKDLMPSDQALPADEATPTAATESIAELASSEPALTHQEASTQIFGKAIWSPTTCLASSWSTQEKWGQLLNIRMMEIEYEYAKSLLEQLRDRGIAGDIVEFGVFEGHWLERLVEMSETIDARREVWGFDSFEGLPDTSARHDLACFTKGQFAAGFDAVCQRLDVANRAHVHLVQGWFCDTLGAPAAAAVRRIAYARIDCDLYQPTVECLEFLSDRLVDGAILVFDDWTYRTDKGETKAFYPWAQRQTHLRFEFLCFNSIGHLYMRVHWK